MKRVVVQRVKTWRIAAEKVQGSRRDREQGLDEILFANGHYWLLCRLTFGAPLLGVLWTATAISALDLSSEMERAVNHFEAIRPVFLGVVLGAVIALTNAFIMVPIALFWLRAVRQVQAFSRPGTPEVMQTMNAFPASLETCARSVSLLGQKLDQAATTIIQGGMNAIETIRESAVTATSATAKNTETNLVALTKSVHASIESVVESARIPLPP